MKNYKYGLCMLAVIMMISGNGYACDLPKEDGKDASHDLEAMHHHERMSKGVFNDPMVKMHKNMMAVKPSGNVDIDFVKGMIPHHQAAIDMAKIELEKGKDPLIRKMAEDIIKAQKQEIKMMNNWISHKVE